MQWIVKKLLPPHVRSHRSAALTLSAELFKEVAEHDCAAKIESKARTACVQLAKAFAYFEADATERSVKELESDRTHVAHLRRTQTAVLRHIDEALQTARGQ